MKALVLLHSATGNTRLVTKYAARRLADHGVEAQVHDVGRRREAPSLDGVEMVGVAFPTMYFWPTLPILRAIDALPRPARPTPAFVLSTAAGDPGAALTIAVERLQARGYLPVAGHWVIASSSYPLHRAAMRFLDTAPVVRGVNRPVEEALRVVWRRWPAVRPWVGVAWHRASETLPVDRDALDRFLASVAEQARAIVVDGAQAPPPDLRGQVIAALDRMGRMYPLEKPVGAAGLRFLHAACTRCGACRKACPTGCVVAEEGGLPRFTTDCVGCFACYNACAHGAVAAALTPPARGRYPGPSPEMRSVFR